MASAVVILVLGMPSVASAAVWSKLGVSPASSEYHDSACVASVGPEFDCMAVGSFVDDWGARKAQARWVGGEPLAVPSIAGASSSELSGVSCSSATSCFAVGSYVASSGVETALVAHWDGTAWISTTPPLPAGAESSALAGVHCPSTSLCVAVGTQVVAGASRQLALRWDGAAWTVEATPERSEAVASELADVFCLETGACWAVGAFVDAYDRRQALTLVYWGGLWRTWTSAEPLDATWSELSGVACPASTECMAVGSYIGSSGVRGTLIVTGSDSSSWAWSVTVTYRPADATASWLSDISCPAELDCAVVGTQVDASGGEIPLAARWNGSSWSLDTVDVARDEASLVGVGCASSDYCAAAGHYKMRGLRRDNAVYATTGGGWSLVDDNGTGGELSDLVCVSDVHCKAIGAAFGLSGNVNVLWELDSGIWSAGPVLAGNADNYWSDISCSAADACTAVRERPGSTAYAKRWNGSTWAFQALPTPADGVEVVVTDVLCAATSSCVAVGRYEQTSGDLVPWAASWDGTSWSLQLPGMPTGAVQSSLRAVACTSATDCMAVGRATDSAGARSLYGARWDGTGWVIDSIAAPAGAHADATLTVEDVSCTAPAACTAVGAYEAGAPDRVGRGLAVRWDGSAWALQDQPAVAGADSWALAGVSCYAADACVAVGHHSDGSKAPLALAWDGTDWWIQPTPARTIGHHSALRSVSCTPAGRCTAVGDVLVANRHEPLALTRSVDATPPQISASGDVVDRDGTTVPDGTYGLRIDASDGSTTDGQWGVKSVEIETDGVRADYVEQPCEQGGCALVHDYAFTSVDHSAGTHQVKAIATDHAGNVSQSSWTLDIHRVGDNPPPLAEADAISYTYDSDGRLSGVLDPAAGAAGYEWDPVGNLLSVERWPTTELRVMEATPSSGKVGAAVSIRGTAFATVAGDNAVEFAGTPATVLSASETELDVEVPAGATSGPITVTTAGSTATSRDPFTVLSDAAPTITGIAPNVVATGGTTTVSGTNFDPSKPANSVTVNQTRAAVSSASSTSLGVEVPAATGSGRVQVTTVEGTATGPYVFVPPLSYTPADVEVTGTVTLDEPTTVSIGTAGKIGLLVFEGQAGQRVSLKATGSGMAGTIGLVDPRNEHFVTAAYSDGAEQYLDAITLSADGTYGVMVDPTDTATGSVTFTLIDVPPDVTEQFDPTPTGDSRTLTPTVPGQNLRATFEGTPGQRVFVKVSDGGAYRTELLNPDGSVLSGTAIWVYNSQTYYLETVTIPASGRYTVHVDPDGPSLEGSTITIYDVPDDPVHDIVPTATGTAQTLTLTPGQAGKLRFDGDQGQEISIASGDTSMSGSLSIRRSDGTEVGAGSFSSSGFVEPVTLPAADTYTITADPSNIQSGSVTLTVYDFPGDVVEEFTPTASGDVKTLTPVAAGQNLRGTFQGTAGQRVFVKVSDGAASRSKLLKPDGSVLSGTALWVYNSQTYYLETVSLPADGTYTVLVDPQGSAIEASTIAIYSVPDDHVRDIAPTVAGHAETIDFSVGQGATLRFQGTAGQRVSVQGSDTSLSGGLTLHRPDGTQIGSSNISPSNFLEPVTLPADGTYTIELDPADIQHGAATITVWDVPPDLTQAFTPTAAGDSATLTPQAPGQNLRATFAGTAGQRIFVRMSDGAASGGKVLRPDDSVLKSSPSWVYNSFTYYFDTFALPADGTYTVLIDPQKADMTGTTVTIYAVADDDVRDIAPVSAGHAETFDFLVGQVGKLRFTGTAGQRVSFQSSDSSLTGPLTMHGPDGAQVAAGNISTANFLEPVTLPTDGTYTLTLDPSNIQSGALTANVYDVPPDVTELFQPTAGGDERTLTPVAPGQNLRATFAGTAGQRVFVKIIGGDADRSTFYRPDGSVLVSSPQWVSNSENTYFDTVTLPSTGTYTVLVDPRKSNMVGSTVTVYDVPADVTGTLTPTAAGDSIEVTTGVGQGAVLSFEGTEGMPIAVSASPSPVGGTFSVRRPDGSVLTSSTISSTTTQTTSTVTLLESGTHSIVVDPANWRTGTVTITLYDKTGFAASLGDGFDMVLASYSLPAGRKSPTVRERKAKAAPRSRRRSLRKPARTAREDRRGRRSRRAAARSKGKRRRPAQRRIDAMTRGFTPASSPHWRRPDVERHRGWMTNAPETPWDDLPALQAPSEETALSGQVLKVNGTPLRGARLRIEGQGNGAVSDASGRFLLRDLNPGDHVLLVEANDIPGTDLRFGTYRIKVELDRRETTVLEQPVWLTALDPAGDLTVPAKTRRRIVVRNPKIPGFEIHIPKGSEIRDKDGKPVRRINLTAVPLDRPPFPLPHFDVPAYFTIQPGGAYLSKGARVIYPNYMQAPSNQRVQFWNYDADDEGWHVYGHGRVSQDAERMEPDRGVRIWEFTGAMIGNGLGPPTSAPPPNGAPSDGDPVDLSTGLFVETNTDLHVPDVIPAMVQRTYRPGDTNYYSFGRGTTSLYDTRVWSQTGDDDPMLILPNGSNISYHRINPESDYYDGIYEPDADAASGRFAGSVLARNEDSGFDLRFRDGTVYVFGNYSPLLAIRDAAGNELKITRDGWARGRVEQVTTPNGRWIRFEYDANNQVTRAVDNSGRAVSYAYTDDAQRRLQTITDVNGGVSTRAYDAAGQMTTLTDARGITYLTNTYDANGRVVRQEQADGSVFEFAYDLWPSGQVQRTHVTSPRGAVRTVTFNEAQQSLSDVRAVGEAIEQETTIVRDPTTHEVTSVTDELGRTTELGYDAHGNLTTVTELAGTADARTTTVVYQTDPSRVTSITDPLDHTTTFSYDARGRVTAITDATTRTYTLAYAGTDPRPSTVTDPDGNSWAFDYVGGDLTAVRDPLGRETRYYTDAAGRRTRVIDPLGNVTTYRFDEANLLRSSTAPSGATTAFDYDANGNLTEVVDARGNAMSATYDSMDRIASATDALAKVATFDYDLNGNLVSLTDRTGKLTTFDYDALDRLTFVGYDTTGSAGSEQYESTVQYSYDAGDRLTQAVDSAAGTFTQAFNAVDQVTSESGPNGTVGYGYDAGGRLTSVDVSGQPTIAYAYDAANRLTGVTRGTDAVALSYDALGRRSSVTLPNGVAQAYSYDAASRLTGIDYAQAGLRVGELRYGHDPVGRRSHVWGAFAATTLPPPLGSATYDAANRRVGQDGSTLTYDAAGNLTADGDATYSWNARHQLESVTRGTATTTFGYDPFGRRLSQSSDTGSRGYLHAGLNVVQEQQDGVPTANVIGGPWLDEVFARVGGAGTHSHLTDALGSTVAVGDASDWPADTSYVYSPFGSTTQQGDPSDNPFQFTGRENDGDGLYHYRARYYTPGQQRFLSEDPLGLAGGDTNFYSYVGGDPLNLVDPLGLISFSDIIGPQADLSHFAAGLWDGALGGIPSAAFGAACWDERHTEGRFVGAVGGGAWSTFRLAAWAGGTGAFSTAGAGAFGGAVGGAHTMAGLKQGGTAEELAAGVVVGAVGGASGGALAATAEVAGTAVAEAAAIVGGAVTGEAISIAIGVGAGLGPGAPGALTTRKRDGC